jgi:hypothetical protein
VPMTGRLPVGPFPAGQTCTLATVRHAHDLVTEAAVVDGMEAATNDRSIERCMQYFHAIEAY